VIARSSRYEQRLLAPAAVGPCIAGALCLLLLLLVLDGKRVEEAIAAIAAIGGG
jgi:hypothetical protein